MIVAAAVPYDDYSGLLKVLEELGRRVEAVIAAGRGTETEVEAVAPFFCELLRFTENVEEEVVFVAVMRAGAGSSAVKARVVREWKVLCKAVRELSEGVLCSVVEGRLKMGVKVRQYGKHSVLAGSGDGIF